MANDPAQGAPHNVRVTSAAFREGERIPAKHTCQGPDVSPALQVSSVPAATKSLAIIMDDPDAPGKTWLHWTAWDLPATTSALAEGADIPALGGREGTTDNGDSGYGGPCPPPGKPHRYFFKVYALSTSLKVRAGAPLDEITAAMKGKVLAWGSLMGTFQR